MRFTLWVNASIALLLTVTLAKQEGFADVEKPQAKKIPKELKIHNHTRIDPYFWMNQRDDPQVLAYLEAENRYTEAKLATTETLQKNLFKELKARIEKDDSSAPYYDRGYFYYSKTLKASNYPIYCRKKGSLDAKEEILIDMNQLADSKEYYAISSLKVDISGNLLAYAEDDVGRRIYDLRFKDLKSGKILPHQIKNMTGNFVWANDSQTIFFAKQDPETLRSYQIYRYSLGAKAPILVYQEDDEQFSTYVSKSKTDRYIFISSHSSTSSEIRYIDADQPDSQAIIFSPRQKDLEYDLSDGGSDFVIHTNYQAKNFQIMSAPKRPTPPKKWLSVVAHDPEIYLESYDVFKDFIVLEEKKDGQNRLRIFDRKSKKADYIPFKETAYLAELYVNRVFDTDTILYSYESLTTPETIYSYHVTTKKMNVVKQETVLGGFNPDNYQSKRIFAKAPDGKLIPISLVHKKGLALDGKNPTLVYGYGSYGITVDPRFSPSRLSLLNRGFVFAIAHIRGSSMLGRPWYEDGKMLNKKNTFTDFIAATEHLIKQKYTNPKKLYAMGGSAGGLLMGAVINMRPDLYHGVIAAVPFVDVVTTMLDDSIPLTTGEYEEWGNPNEKPYYEYMLSYSPYDNVDKKDYPNILVTTGYHDSQVQYWEPAKWIAKLRDSQKNDSLVLLKVNMSAGHSGASGRFDYLEELALDYAFLLHLEGIKS